MSTQKFFFIPFFASTIVFHFFLSGMEDTHKYGHQVICPIKTPRCVAFLPDNTLAIGGLGGLVFYNPTTHTSHNQNATYQKDNDLVFDYSTNRDRTLLTVSSLNNIVTHNTTSQKILSTLTPVYPYTFPMRTNNNLITYAFTDLGCLIINSQLKHPNIYLTTQKNIVTTHKIPITYNRYNNTIIVPENNRICKILAVEDHALVRTIDCGNTAFVIGTECHQHQPFLAINLRDDGFNVIPANKQSDVLGCCHFYHKHKEHNGAFYPSMTFSSHDIIALLSFENTIQFWNFKTQQCVAEMQLNPEDALPPQNKMTKRLSFSMDGTMLAVSLKNNCYILSLPFNVLPPAQQKKYLFFLAWVLQQYDEIALPYDVIYEILRATHNT